MCTLKLDYPPRDLYLEVIALQREISKAVYPLHSGSMQRDEGRTTEVGWGAVLVSFTLQGLALEHKHPAHSNQTAPHKAKES